MAVRKRKEILSIWLMRPADGRVRKLRLSPRAAFLSGSALFFSLFVFFLLIGDYARQTSLRQESQRLLTQIIGDRDSLIGNVKSMEAKLKSLEAADTQKIESKITAKLNKLREAVKSAMSLGLVKKSDVPILSGDAGVGGKEIDCTGKSEDRCSLLLDGKGLASELGTAGMENRVQTSDELVKELDVLIDAFKKAPAVNPTGARISSGFGIRLSPFTGNISKHEGVDYSLPYGAEVNVTAVGTVKAVKYHREYGLYIDVAHNGVLSTRYAHLSKALVKVGDKVDRGDIIGLVGSSGAVTAPHLHYEVRVNGVAKNPQLVLALGKKLSEAL